MFRSLGILTYLCLTLYKGAWDFLAFLWVHIRWNLHWITFDFINIFECEWFETEQSCSLTCMLIDTLQFHVIKTAFCLIGVIKDKKLSTAIRISYRKRERDDGRRHMYSTHTVSSTLNNLKKNFLQRNQACLRCQTIVFCGHDAKLYFT